jgi:hypothetical protein
MSSCLIQALNTTSTIQREITPPVTYYDPVYSSTNIPVQPHYAEANTNGDALVTWGMNTACGTKAGQIDGRGLHTVEGTNSRNKENDERYVGWDGTGLSLIQRVRSGLAVTNIPTPNQHGQENHPSTSLVHQTSTTSIPAVVY